jgi:hypothetical protein
MEDSFLWEYTPMPLINQQRVPAVVEGRPLPLLILIGQYHAAGAWTFEDDTITGTVCTYLRAKGELYPHEQVGYPVVFPDRVEFRYYGASKLRTARQATFAAISDGFARIQQMKIAKIVSRPLPLEVVIGCILPFL